MKRASIFWMCALAATAARASSFAVDGGTLALGSGTVVAASAFRLGAAGTLSGDGEVAAAANLAGTVSPGTSVSNVGTLRFAKDVWFSGGTCRCHADGNERLDRIEAAGDVGGTATVQMSKKSSHVVPLWQIVVQGAAEVTAAPDMVKVTANAGVSGKTIAEAQAGMNKIIDAVTRKLLELGVADDDIVTTSYAYYTTYDYSGESPVMNGYQANHTLGITCRDVDMLDSVVGVLVDCGMSEIYGIEYDVSTRSELYQQALKLAIETAAKKADVMAKAAGQTIDHLESITENGSYNEYMINMNDSAARAQAEDSGTGIRSGSISVKASVTAVYETK